MADQPSLPEPSGRRSLDDLDESIASADYLAAKRRKQSGYHSTWIGILIIALTTAGFLAWRWKGGGLRARRVDNASHAIDSLGAP